MRRAALAAALLLSLCGAQAAAARPSAQGRLLHRVAALQRTVPERGAYVGTDARARVHMRRAYWTSGFLAGSLWQAATLRRGPDRFGRWALGRTRANFGRERADTHDLGFIYELSSVTAYRRLCGTRRARRGRGCRALRRSGLAAARRLLALAATNRTAGSIPTRGSSREADTIVDSLMNLPLLYWAGRQTRDGRFRRVAARHVAVVRRLLIRADGSTFQSVHFDRASGRVLRRHTHQGLSRSSTWARGQAWAVYGLTTSAAALRDPAVLADAERTAGWTADHLPASGVPPWDYSAGASAATDVSAGAITAAGLYRLAALCRTRRCAQPGRWRPLADRMLRGVLHHVSRTGYLGGSAGTYGRGPKWDDDAEMVYAVYYTLEALNLRRHSR